MATNIVPTTSPVPTVNPPVTSATTSSSTSSTANTVGVDQNTIAGNFTTFLQLLTTQLQNQNPLDSLDTNQFTAQLVQFAQVEQQLRSNDQLATLVSLCQSARRRVLPRQPLRPGAENKNMNRRIVWRGDPALADLRHKNIRN
jgi:flagellar basal-body rod modification protein FlgD